MEDQQKRMALSLLAYAAQRDVQPQQLCKLAGIQLEELKKPSGETLSATQMNNLWTNAGQLTNDPLFGLHFGESLQIAALGMVGEIIKSSGTVGEAITHAAALSHLVTDLFRMEVTSPGKTFTINYISLTDATPSFSFLQLMDFFMVFTVHELDGLLLQKIQPKAVRYPYVVSNIAEYERVLRCRPVKRTGEYALEFDKKYWDEPILSANYELQSLLLKKVQALPEQAAGTQSLQARIYNYLLTNAYLGIISLEQMAANFNISPRSLQRKLKEEGVKYQDIADAVRKSLAMHYMASGNYPLKEVSYMLGYNELSAFTRAFKRWTGDTPGSYQHN
ncbi:AraC family transcriptional regulator [Chitinophaga niabensis]|uniref:AraC-type DNA-binding protein n=1 Tax=Chitinophaga niabensis TaxID=536979 RepID=A0A1N6J325_9BACT|nr:AraC family transcriptional regulator [Chitinophaga niabensis]SIO38734.1 AraC-type DNA-binding protein [Chitinophaga niabensis]